MPGRPSGRSPSSNLRGLRRPALVGACTVVALAMIAGWRGRSGDPEAWQIAAIVAGLAGTAMWVRSSRRGADVERLGPWLLLAVIVGAQQATGGVASPYLVLSAVVVLYAAVFSSTPRFALVTAVAAVATLAEFSPQSGIGFDAVVMLLTWLSAAVFGHLLVRRLDSAAQTDGLTGLWNHAAFWRRLHAEEARVRRSNGTYSVLLIDVDRFKALNDRHGHQAGDAVLRRLADILANRIRGSDVLARYGGEEFAVLLPDTEQVAASEVAEKLRRLLAVAGISVSVGVADNADGTNPDEVVKAADSALYLAKATGRARVCTAAQVGGTATAGRQVVARRRSRAS